MEALLARVFHALEAHSIPYCVPRSFEGLPHRVDGDVDILVGLEDIDRIDWALRDVLAELLVVRRIEKDGHLQFHVLSVEELERAIQQDRAAIGIMFDFQKALEWKGIPYLDTQDVLKARRRHGDFYVAGSEHRTANIVCHAILEKKFIKRRQREVIEEAICEQGEAALGALRPVLGAPLVARLYSALRKGDDAEAMRLRKRVIAALLFSSGNAVRSYVSFLARKCMRIAAAVLFPPGVLVATAGPDGSGKSTLIKRVGTVLSNTAYPVKEQLMGGGQFILPTKRLVDTFRKIRGRRSAWREGNGALGSGFGSSWADNLGVIHYFLDLWARYVFQIRPVLARGGVVLCDRYFYDILARNVWLSKKRLSRSLLLAMTPTPEVTVVFSGDPEVIAARKREIPSHEAARQLMEFASLKDRIRGSLEVDAASPLDENAARVVHAILKRGGDGDGS